LDLLTTYYQQEEESFKKSPQKVQKLMKIGEYKLEKARNTRATAALMLTIQLIYNMEEAIMRV
jgi:hypothetical protein